MKEIVPKGTRDQVVKVPSDSLGRVLGGSIISLPGPTPSLESGSDSMNGVVLLLIDCSGTMKANNKLEGVRDGALNFARDALNRGLAVGIIQFDTQVTEVCTPTRDLGAIRDALVRLEAGGITNMAEAIAVAHRRLQRHAGNRIMFIVTDGIPNGDNNDPQASIAAAARAKKDGITILALGTDDAPETFLKELQS